MFTTDKTLVFTTEKTLVLSTNETLILTTYKTFLSTTVTEYSKFLPHICHLSILFLEVELSEFRKRDR